MPQDVFLLDTDIVSLFGRPKTPPGLRPWLLDVGIHRLAISYPTITELMRGAHLKRKDDPDKAEIIMAWIRRILAVGFPTPSMTAEVAEVYAHMTAVPSLRNMWTVQSAQKSNRLGHDLMIAAVSITHRLPIISANISDFERIHDHFPLPGLYHPLEGRWRLLPEREFSMPLLDRTLPDTLSVRLPKIGTIAARPSRPDECLPNAGGKETGAMVTCSSAAASGFDRKAAPLVYLARRPRSSPDTSRTAAVIASQCQDTASLRNQLGDDEIAHPKVAQHVTGEKRTR